MTSANQKLTFWIYAEMLYSSKVGSEFFTKQVRIKKISYNIK